MSLKVDRFEKKELSEIGNAFKLVTSTTILIKDHKSDRVIAHIDLGTQDENKELADRIINTIEEYVLENEEE